MGSVKKTLLSPPIFKATGRSSLYFSCHIDRKRQLREPLLLSNRRVRKQNSRQECTPAPWEDRLMAAVLTVLIKHGLNWKPGAYSND